MIMSWLSGLMGVPQAVAQRPSGKGRGERLKPKRRSGQPQRLACSWCAGGGKPRALPRGTGGRPLGDSKFHGDAPTFCGAPKISMSNQDMQSSGFCNKVGADNTPKEIYS